MSIPPRVQDIITGTTSSVKGFLAYFLKPNNPQDFWRDNGISPDQTTFVDQCKCGVCGTKPWRRPEQTPRANNEYG